MVLGGKAPEGTSNVVVRGVLVDVEHLVVVLELRHPKLRPSRPRFRLQRPTDSVARSRLGDDHLGRANESAVAAEAGLVDLGDVPFAYLVGWRHHGQGLVKLGVEVVAYLAKLADPEAL